MASFTLSVEDSSPLISYAPAGAWTDSPPDDAQLSTYSGSSLHTTSAQGATATINFQGTGISIIGGRRPNYGSYMISVDGIVITNSDASSSSAQAQQLLGSATGLEHGSHTAVITNTGSAIDIDRVDFQGQIGESGATMSKITYDDNDSTIKYGPSPDTWNVDAQADFMDGAIHFSSTPGATATMKFGGNAVAIYGTTAPNHADITVTVDGRATTVAGGSNGLAQKMHAKTLMYYVDNLDVSEHTLVISSNSQSTDTPFIDLDRVEVFSASSSSQNQQAESTSKSGFKMPKGALIGIAAGSAAAFLLIVGVAVFFLLRFRKRRKVLEMPEKRAPSPMTPDDHLPMQSASMLEAGLSKPGSVWRPPQREPSYHQSHHARSRSQTGSIGGSSFQSTSALITLGVPKPPAIRGGDLSRSASALSMGSESESGFSSFSGPMLSVDGPRPMASNSRLRDYDSDVDQAPSILSNLDMNALAALADIDEPRSRTLSRKGSAASTASKTMLVTARPRSRSRTRKSVDGETIRASGYDTDATETNTDPRAFPTAPRTRSRSRPREDVGHSRDNSDDSLISGSGSVARYGGEKRSLDEAGNPQGDPRAFPTTPKSSRSRSRPREDGAAIPHFSSSRSLRSDYESDAGYSSADPRAFPVTPQTRSRSRPREPEAPIIRVPSSTSLRSGYESDASSIPPTIPPRSHSRVGHREPTRVESPPLPAQAQLLRPTFLRHSRADSDTSAASSGSMQHPRLKSLKGTSGHARTGSDNSFLSVDPMAQRGRPRTGRASPLPKVTFATTSRSPGHSRNTSTSSFGGSDVSEPLDTNILVGLAERKRSASIERPEGGSLRRQASTESGLNRGRSVKNGIGSLATINRERSRSTDSRRTRGATPVPDEEVPPMPLMPVAF